MSINPIPSAIGRGGTVGVYKFRTLRFRRRRVALEDV